MPRASASLHGKTFTTALFLLMIGGFFGGKSLLSSTVKPQAGTEQGIVIRHSLASSLVILRAARPGAEMIEFRSEKTYLAFSVPSVWTMREVRGTTLASIRSEPGGPGITKWTVPPQARISFMTTRPGSLSVRSVGSGSLLLKFLDVNLETEQTLEQSHLLQKEETRLW